MDKFKRDGIDHINVYSKGKTSLGRFLSNFAYTTIVTEDGQFDSIEGYWYWLKTKDCKLRENLREQSGFMAKNLGRSLEQKEKIDWKEFKRKICAAIDEKLKRYPNQKKELMECNLPLTHYYVYNGRKIPGGSEWVIDHLRRYQP